VGQAELLGRQLGPLLASVRTRWARTGAVDHTCMAPDEASSIGCFSVQSMPSSTPLGTLSRPASDSPCRGTRAEVQVRWASRSKCSSQSHSGASLLGRTGCLCKVHVCPERRRSPCAHVHTRGATVLANRTERHCEYRLRDRQSLRTAMRLAPSMQIKIDMTQSRPGPLLGHSPRLQNSPVTMINKLELPATASSAGPRRPTMRILMVFSAFSSMRPADRGMLLLTRTPSSVHVDAGLSRPTRPESLAGGRTMADDDGAVPYTAAGTVETRRVVGDCSRGVVSLTPTTAPEGTRAAAGGPEGRRAVGWDIGPGGEGLG
jgi:hypothetical protein